MRQEWADYRVFWREFRHTFQSTGAVLPSGRALSTALARFVRPANDDDLAQAKGDSPAGRRILEVGPGTGAVTGQIVRHLQPSDRLVLVERNSQFVSRLEDRLAHDPVFQKAASRLTIVHAGVEELPEEERFDVIVSGLPLNNFSVAFVEQILDKLRRLLAPGGTLSFFEYVAIRRAKALVSRPTERVRLRGIAMLMEDLCRTAQVQRECVLTNVPPAWVHHVRFG